MCCVIISSSYTLHVYKERSAHRADCAGGNHILLSISICQQRGK